MKFPYQSYPGSGTGSRHDTTVWRPVIPVRVIGPNGDDAVPGLVDTGANDTLLPDFLIDLLGIVLDPNDVGVTEAIDGSTLTVRYATVDLDLANPRTTDRWNARVGFHPRRNAVFGHTGFLDDFSALFNGRTREVSLLPNNTAPPFDHP